MPYDEDTIIGLLERAPILIENHNETHDRKLPAIEEFTQRDVNWCAKHSPMFVEMALRANPNLQRPSSKSSNPNPLARTFTRNDVNLTKEELEKAYVEHFTNDISFNKIAKSLFVHPATLGRLLNRMYIQRNTNLHGLYEKEDNDPNVD